MEMAHGPVKGEKHTVTVPPHSVFLGGVKQKE